MLSINIKAPDFSLLDSFNKKVSLKDFKGKWVVLYFYPKDGTPGCSIEAVTFSKALPDFNKEGAVVLGVSKDSCMSHEKFVKSKGLSVTLLSDPNAEVMRLYDVYKPKSFMGRELLGTLRTTYLINSKGFIVFVWPNVNVLGHAEAVLNKLKSLKDSLDSLEQLK